MKNIQYTPADIKTAYQIVSHDLFNQLSSAPAEAMVKLGNLGKFKKTQTVVQSKEYGQHVYYKLSFRCFSKLKAAFHNQLRKQYKLQ
jgi:hypothetical protein